MMGRRNKNKKPLDQSTSSNNSRNFARLSVDKENQPTKCDQKPPDNKDLKVLATDNSDNSNDFISELDSFRQRWRRELVDNANKDSASDAADKVNNLTVNESKANPAQSGIKSISDFESSYQEAKQLILEAVQLKNTNQHQESLKLYQQAIELHPGIAYEVHTIETEASERRYFGNSDAIATSSLSKANKQAGDGDTSQVESIPLYNRLARKHNDLEDYGLCKPKINRKNEVHISDLPHEMINQIIHHVIGQQLDLASLERLGLVSRGFYLLTKSQSIWRSICAQTWSKEIIKEIQSIDSEADWRQVFLQKPRVNFDGVYISRTKYLRAGDVGFQDCIYRPFHVISYFRYIRFFADKRAIILTTNEEPDKILPIFRHAQNASQFSTELSVLNAVFEFDEESNHVNVVAEKDCRVNLSARDARRQNHQQWHTQTPISRKFTLKFELKTNHNRPFTNNVLKWFDYKILSRYEHNQELTSYDMTPEHFPSLNYCRVKMFNLKMSQPLLNY